MYPFQIIANGFQGVIKNSRQLHDAVTKLRHTGDREFCQLKQASRGDTPTFRYLSQLHPDTVYNTSTGLPIRLSEYLGEQLCKDLLL